MGGNVCLGPRNVLQSSIYIDGIIFIQRVIGLPNNAQVV